MKKLFVAIVVALAATSCSNDAVDEPTSPDAGVLSRSTEAAPSAVDYSLSQQLIEQYARMTHKNNPITQIIPWTVGADTLAYHVQYTTGYEIYVADRRFAPAMIVSEDGTVDEMTEDLYLADKFGLLNYIAEVKASSEEMSVNPVWNFLDPRREPNSIMPRGMVSGMWRPANEGSETGDEESNPPEVETEEITSPRLTYPSWRQTSPYNEFTPYSAEQGISGTHSRIGCVPLSTAQAVCYFRQKDNKGIGLPSVAMPQGPNTLYKFEYPGTEVWNEISDMNNEPTNILLAYTGVVMGLTAYDYLHDGSSVLASQTVAYIGKALNHFGLSYSSCNGYNYSNVISSLSGGSPVIISANATGEDDGHTFVIDGYKHTQNYHVKHYVWVEGYHPTEEELQRFPPEFFEPPIHDNDGTWTTRTLVGDYVRIRMNWGYGNPSQINKYYMAYSYTSGEGGYNSYTNPPYWSIAKETNNYLTYTSVSSMVYDIKNKQ